MESEIHERCGTRHPNYPNLTCQNWGKCIIDWHVGHYEHRDKYGLVRWVEIVEYGKAAEDYATEFGWAGYRLLRLA